MSVGINHQVVKIRFNQLLPLGQNQKTNCIKVTAVFYLKLGLVLQRMENSEQWVFQTLLVIGKPRTSIFSVILSR